MKELRIFLMCLKSCGPLVCLSWWATSLISCIFFFFWPVGGGGRIFISGDFIFGGGIFIPGFC